jgi:serine/threonine protein phosphatase PrpC
MRRVGNLPIALVTDVGSVRSDNQDRLAVLRCNSSDDRCVVALLCDGMGGLASGGECAALAMSNFFATFLSVPNDLIGARIRRSIHAANLGVYGRYRGTGGTTLSAVILTTGGIYFANVGDSRVYTWTNRLDQLSTDDTLDAHLNKPVSYRRNELLQYVGMGDGIEPHLGTTTISSREQLLIATSDGLHVPTGPLMDEIIRHADDAAAALKRLAELSKWCGGKDNASAIAISVDSVARQGGESTEAFEISDPFGDLTLMSYAPAYQSRGLSEPNWLTPATVAPVEVKSRTPAVQVAPKAPRKGKPKASKAKSKKRALKKPSSGKPQLKIEFGR